MTTCTTFLCGGVNSAGWTVVAGTARVLGLVVRFPGAEELEAFRTMATEWEAFDASDSVLLFGLSVLSAEIGCSGDCAMAGWLARLAAKVLLLMGRVFLEGSIRTAFSMQISWVYELKLVNVSNVAVVGEGEKETYPWPSLMAFVYGARNDMPLEPLEIFSG